VAAESGAAVDGAGTVSWSGAAGRAAARQIQTASKIIAAANGSMNSTTFGP
jgi:hypothetical protein